MKGATFVQTRQSRAKFVETRQSALRDCLPVGVQAQFAQLRPIGYCVFLARSSLKRPAFRSWCGTMECLSDSQLLANLFELSYPHTSLGARRDLVRVRKGKGKADLGITARRPI